MVQSCYNAMRHSSSPAFAHLQVLKRPGVEAFLLEMGRRYEVVLYTDEPAMYADPVVNKIDPHRAITYRLYRQDTQV